MPLTTEHSDGLARHTTGPCEVWAIKRKIDGCLLPPINYYGAAWFFMGFASREKAQAELERQCELYGMKPSEWEPVQLSAG